MAGLRKDAEMYPTGIVINTATGRFHPITFQPAPLPGGETGPLPGISRYRTLGHHTAGFDTREDAVAWVNSKAPMLRLLDRTWEWDGAEVPAMTEYFSDEELIAAPPEA